MITRNLIDRSSHRNRTVTSKMHWFYENPNHHNIYALPRPWRKYENMPMLLPSSASLPLPTTNPPPSVTVATHSATPETQLHLSSGQLMSICKHCSVRYFFLLWLDELLLRIGEDASSFFWVSLAIINIEAGFRKFTYQVYSGKQVIKFLNSLGLIDKRN